MLFKYKNEIKNLKTNLNTFLTENQISSLKHKNKKGFQWSNDSITNALKIKFTCRTSGYEELLNLNYPLPSLRTLRRKLENIKFHSGILDEIFTMMKLKIANMNDYEKHCVLVLDEMFITEGITYDVGTKTFIGDVTLPQHQGMATHGLVFMLGGNQAGGSKLLLITLPVSIYCIIFILYYNYKSKFNYNIVCF